MTDYYVAFWNLENLFDVNQSPRRTDKLQRTIGSELKGWTKKILDKKIKTTGLSHKANEPEKRTRSNGRMRDRERLRS